MSALINRSQPDDESTLPRKESLEGWPHTEPTLHPAELQVKIQTTQSRDKETKKLYSQKKDLRKKFRSKESQNAGLQRLIAQKESEMDELRDDMLDLQQELQKCRDDLFRVQPLVHTSDTEILSQFESLSQQISGWVDAEICAAEANMGSNTRLFSEGENNEEAEFLQKFDHAGEYLLVSITHQRLLDKLFGEHVYLFGLPLGTVDILQKAEKSMATLTPQRGKSSVVPL